VSQSRSEYDIGRTLLCDGDEAREWAQLLALTMRAENEKKQCVY
jgi:hypothetical protein